MSTSSQGYPVAWPSRAPIVAIVAFVALGALYAVLDAERAGPALMRAGLNTGIQYAALAPLLILALWRSRARDLTPLWIAGLVYLVQMAALMVGTLDILPGLTFNWLGKVLETAWMVVFVLLASPPAAREAGLTTWLARGSLVPALMCTALFMVLTIGGQGIAYFGPESLLFQLTMPGLGEELAFRGVLLALLNRIFGRPWKVLGAQVGWGWVITSVLFGIVHMIFFDASLAVVFLPAGALTMLFGFAAGWMRERTGTVWAAVIFHNLVNAVPQLLGLLTGA